MEPDTARDVSAPSPVKKNHGIEFKEVKFVKLEKGSKMSTHGVFRDVDWRPKITWVKGGGKPRCLRWTLKAAKCWFISQVKELTKYFLIIGGGGVHGSSVK